MPVPSKSKLARQDVETPDNDEPLIDTTQPLPKRSKKTERLQRKFQKRSSKKNVGGATYGDLPPEIWIQILGFLRPSDIFNLFRVDRSMREFISEDETSLVRRIISIRYAVLAKVFPLPKRLRKVSAELREALNNPLRQKEIRTRNRFQHIPSIDCAEICTCMTCVIAWNHLGFLLDFAHWFPRLQTRDGARIPIIERKEGNPGWNRELLERHRERIMRALESPLFYARILEEYLRNMAARVEKWSMASSKLETAFGLTRGDIESGTDLWLERYGRGNFSGVPFNRDQYYNVETYVPNRSWKKEEKRWRYWPREQHEIDLEIVGRFHERHYRRKWEELEEEKKCILEEEMRKDKKQRDGAGESNRRDRTAAVSGEGQEEIKPNGDQQTTNDLPASGPDGKVASLPTSEHQEKSLNHESSGSPLTAAIAPTSATWSFSALATTLTH